MNTFALTLIAFAALLAAVYFFHSRNSVRKYSDVIINNYASQNHLLTIENRSLKEQLDELGEAGATLLLIDQCVTQGKNIEDGPGKAVIRNAILFDAPVTLKDRSKAVGICYDPDKDILLDGSRPEPGRHPGLQYILPPEYDESVIKTQPLDAMDNIGVLQKAIGKATRNTK